MSMQNLLLVFAEVMPIDHLINEMSTSIEKYKSEPSDENLRLVQMYCSLFLAKEVVANKGLEQTMKNMERTQQINERFNDLS